MAWPYLKPSDMSQIRTCVDCAVDNSEAHKDELGHTDADKKKSTEKLSKKMQPSPNDQKEYLRIKYDRYSDRGQVGPPRLATFASLARPTTMSRPR